MRRFPSFATATVNLFGRPPSCATSPTATARRPIWPEHLPARTRIDQWAEWAKVNVVLNFTGSIFWRVVRTPPRQRDASAIGEAIRVLDCYLDIAETRLERAAYLCGNDLTLADVQLGHILYRYFDIDIERRERANLRGYYERLVRRPAYREHVMISYEDLRAAD